ncbi:MAG: cobyrinic acid ac-diamide synthase [Rhodocyclaceae bacterium]|nr:MAG: cobyrinic acid ac-diamide synthase [Rhodocyclaceae bacterium]
MKVLALVNEKGGAGKSTAAINIACAMHRQGKSVVLIDADPQGTARDWREASPSGLNLPPVVALDRPELLISSIKTLAAEFAVIDTPAKAEKMSASVIRIADVAIIPVQPSGADVWASAAAVKLIQAKKDLGGAIDAAFLATRISSNTKLSKQILSGEWNEYGLDMLDTAISNRVAYAQALTEGMSIYETRDGEAKGEIDLILQELEVAGWL